MNLDGVAVLFLGSIGLGLVHGVEPGHGWPVAASYALNQSNKWLYGFAASFILGVGHLVSSIAMVAAFFWLKEYFNLAQHMDWMQYIAGALLIALGARVYFHGHSHGHDEGDHDDHSHDDHHSHEEQHHHDHGHSEHGHHEHDHEESTGAIATLKSVVPFVGGHSHPSADEASEQGLWGIASFAFLLGFAHEEEFQIIGLCLGADHCLALMLTYAIAVIVGIVGLTLLLVAGYERYEERVEQYTEYLPAFSAAVLILMGIGFIVGVF